MNNNPRNDNKKKKKKGLSATRTKMILDEIKGTKTFAADFRKDVNSKKKDTKKVVVKDSFFKHSDRDDNDNDNGNDDSDDSDDSDDDDNDNIESIPSTSSKVTIKTTTGTKKKSRHAPSSVSSLRSAYYERGAPNLNSSGVGVTIGAHRYKPKDPRSISLISGSGTNVGVGGGGNNNNNGGGGRYEFLDELRNDEIDRLQKNVVAWKTTGKKGRRLRKQMGKRSTTTKNNNNTENDYEEGEGISAESDGYTLEKLLRERAEDKRGRANRRAKITVNKQMKEDITSGKRGAYHLKRRERKFMEKEARLEEERGSKKKINTKEVSSKAEEDRTVKRRKKNMSKAAGLMPFARDAF